MIAKNLIRDLKAYKRQCQTGIEFQPDLTGDRYASGFVYATELSIRAANLTSDMPSLYSRISKLADAWAQKIKAKDVIRGDAFVLGVCNGLLRANRILAAYRGSMLLWGQP